MKTEELLSRYVDGEREFSDADLRAANLSGADLEHNSTVISACLGNHRFILREGEPSMILAGCRWFTVAEAEAHYAYQTSSKWTHRTKAYGEECSAVVEFLKRAAIGKGWAV